MSLLMMLAMGSRRAYVPTEHTKTFTQNESWTAPVGVAKLTKAIGHGGRGKDGTYVYIQSWSGESRSVTKRPDGTTTSYRLSSFTGTGATPGDTCDPYSAPDGSGNVSTICYYYTNTSHYDSGSSGSTTIQTWSAESRGVTKHADGTTTSYHLSYFSGNGATPSNSCDPYGAPDGAGNSSTICYYYTNTSSSNSGTPPSTGPSATGFGKVFPGSTGNQPPADVTFSNVVVTPGAPYSVVVPTGGSITITWME